MQERHLDDTAHDPAPQSQRQQRPWIGVFFECCNVYARIYRSPADRCYTGKCPKCGRKVVVAVGPDGVTSRIFRAKLS